MASPNAWQIDEGNLQTLKSNNMYAIRSPELPITTVTGKICHEIGNKSSKHVQLIARL